MQDILQSRKYAFPLEARAIVADQEVSTTILKLRFISHKFCLLNPEVP